MSHYHFETVTVSKADTNVGVQDTLVTTFTLELADGDIITSQNRIVALFKNADKYSHLLYNSQLYVKARIGNDFYYEIYPNGKKAMRRSYVQTLIPDKFIETVELLDDIETVLKGETRRNA